MPEQIIYVPNPPPDPSLLPDDILVYKKELNHKGFLTPKERSSIVQFRRAADYIAAGASPIFRLPSRRVLTRPKQP